MKKRVVLSCTPNNIYDFFLPISVRLWRNRIGYEPIVILVGGEADWSLGHSKAVYDEIRGKEQIEFFRGIVGIPDSAVSMALRQNVSALDFDQDDLILIGDVDLFPVERQFYHQYDPSRNPIGIYYADAHGSTYWPAYGMVMPVRNWREVMGVTVGDFRGSVERMMTEESLKSVEMWDGEKPWDSRFWFFDEKFASFKIKGSRFFNDIAMFPSTYKGKRPHREALPRKPNSADYVDFHCSRPGWNGENWPGIRDMLSQIIPADIDWLDRYVAAYRESL